MKNRALKTAVLGMLIATAAAAQDAATFNVPDPAADPTQGAGKPSSHKIPPFSAWKGENKDEASPAPVRTMPEYRVTEFRPEVFRQRDLYTRQGMADLSFQRHPGLLIGNFFNSNEKLAYETFLSDDWNRTKADYWDLAYAMTLGGDAREGRMITKAVDEEDSWMRAESENTASAPTLGRFQIASAEAGSRLLELPEQTIDIPFLKRTW
jgi:hypothetical protein